MTRSESRRIELALQILRNQYDCRFSAPDRGPSLQLALRVLAPYTGKHCLIDFWNAAENENPLQRLNNLKKLYRVIEGHVRHHALRRSG